MEFTLPYYDFYNVFKSLRGSVSSKAGDVHSLLYFLVTEDKSMVSVSGPDYQINTTIKTEEIKESGEFFVDYGRMKSFILSFAPFDEESGIGVKQLKFKTPDSPGKIIISAVNYNGEDKKTSGRLTIPVTMSLPPKNIDEPETIDMVMNSSLYKEIFNKVYFAINIVNSLPTLRGVNVILNDEYISFASTDGIVVSEYEIKSVKNIKIKDGNYIVSYGFLSSLYRLISDDTQIRFTFSDSVVTAYIDNFRIRGSLITSGQYPQYKPLFKKYDKEFVINKIVFMGVLSAFKNSLDKEDLFRITMKISDNSLGLYTECMEFDSIQNVDMDTDFAIDINGSILINVISSIKDDDIVVKFTDSDSPLIFDSHNFSNQKSLIVPIRRRK